jgi:hypothetical protein
LQNIATLVFVSEVPLCANNNLKVDFEELQIAGLRRPKRGIRI